MTMSVTAQSPLSTRPAVTSDPSRHVTVAAAAAVVVASRCSGLTLSDIVQLFEYPIEDAAARCKLSLTTFKYVCRSLGVPRWPYRRVCANHTTLSPILRH